jgi:hypothetical protein
MTDAPALTAAQTIAKNRQAIWDVIRNRPGIKTADVCASVTLMYRGTQNHLYWLSQQGYIRRKGMGAGLAWFAADNPPTPEIFDTAAEDPAAIDAAADERRREMLRHIRAHGPISMDRLREALKLPRTVVREDLAWLRKGAHIFFGREEGSQGWMWLKQIPRPGDPETTPTVGLKPDRKWCEPGPVIKRVKDGIPYTYKAAPKGPYHVEIPAGGGVISGDNPRLTAALMGACSNKMGSHGL